MIIGNVESKSLRGRLIKGAIFFFLLLGSLTMIYPFAIMISGSTRSEMDATDLGVVPKYLVDRDTLYKKFLETKYNQKVADLNAVHLSRYYSFNDVQSPDLTDAAVEDMRAFIRSQNLPNHWQVLGGIAGIATVPEPLRELRKRLAERFDDDVDAYARAVGSPTRSWTTIILPLPRWTTQRYDFEANALHEVYFEMLHEAPPANRQLVSLTGAFLQNMIYPVYAQSDVSAYNRAHAVPLADFGDFRLPAVVPDQHQPQLRKEWIEFVRRDLHASFVVLTGIDLGVWRAALQQNYHTIADLNDAWNTKHTAFDQVTLPDGQTWLGGQQHQDYLQFVHQTDPQHYRLVGPEFAWREWLKQRYASLDLLNRAHGIEHQAWGDVWFALPAVEYTYAQEHAVSLRRTFALRNYVNVFDELLFEGRALLNTVIYVSLALVFSLLVNPLAAYAMSRFELPGTYKFLLILMATVSFPPMVAMIPQFIMLRKLHLLNTFAALVIPSIANGYLIFLLKGFFDSLPRDLYDAARIDGASEVRMFFQITMALSKPILAVLALQTFQGAYLAFLYPLLVAPDEDMWLLSVWLFQYQQRSNTPAVFASVIIASIPTFIIFLFAQRTIMRGIVVPTEK